MNPTTKTKAETKTKDRNLNSFQFNRNGIQEKIYIYQKKNNIQRCDQNPESTKTIRAREMFHPAEAFAIIRFIQTDSTCNSFYYFFSIHLFFSLFLSISFFFVLLKFAQLFVFFFILFCFLFCNIRTELTRSTKSINNKAWWLPAAPIPVHSALDSGFRYHISTR